MIIIKFKKGYNLKIAALSMAVLFLPASLVCGAGLSDKSNLRVPFINQERLKNGISIFPVIIATGGTIDMSGAESRHTSGGVAKILKNMEHVIYRQVFQNPPDSTNIGPDGVYSWDNIIDAIRKTLSDKGQNISKRLAVPIVFTGAHSPATEEGSDAVPNLAKSLFVVSNKDTPPLVYVVIGDNIFLGGNIRKLYVSPSQINEKDKSIGYFDTYGDAAGKVVEGKDGFSIEWNREFLKWADVYTKGVKKLKGAAGIVVTHGTDTLEETALIASLEFGRKNVTRVPDNDFGYVEHIAVGYNTSPEVFKFYREYLIDLQMTDPEKRYGLIIQGDFSRNKDLSRIKEELNKITACGIPVFTGSVKTWEIVKDIGIGIIPAELSYGKARTKLSWLLRKGVKYKDVGAELGNDYMGEIVFRSKKYLLMNLIGSGALLPEEEENYKRELAKLSGEKQKLPSWMDREVFDLSKEVIIGFPGMRTEPVAAAVKRLLKELSSGKEKNQGVPAKLVIIGFGDGNLPVGEQSVISVFEQYLDENNYYLLQEFRSHMNNIITDKAEKQAGFNPNLDTAKEAFNNVIKGLPDKELEQLLKKYDYRSRDLNRSIFKLIRKEVFSDLHGDDITVIRQIEMFQNKMTEKYPFMSDRFRDLSKSSRSIDELCSNMSKAFKGLSMDDSIKLIRIHPSFLSQRIIKDAMMNSHPLLKTIGQAVDSGIEVSIKTKAFRSRTNTMMYELGNQLLVIGVDSDETPGWRIVLNPKAREGFSSEFTDKSEDLVLSFIRHQLRNYMSFLSLLEDFSTEFAKKQDLSELVKLCKNNAESWWNIVNNGINSGSSIKIELDNVSTLVFLTKELLEKFDEARKSGFFEYKEGEDVKWLIDFTRNSLEQIDNFIKTPYEFLNNNNNFKVISFHMGKMLGGRNIKVESLQEDVYFEGNAEQEALIILSILSNFIDNSKRSGATNIEITFTKEEGFVKISISNNGNSIPEEELFKIFNKGFTTKSSNNAANSSGGDGLFFTLQYLKFKGGKICVDTKAEDSSALKLSFDDRLENRTVSLSEKKEKGVTFSIWLPVRSDKGLKANTSL